MDEKPEAPETAPETAPVRRCVVCGRPIPNEKRWYGLAKYCSPYCKMFNHRRFLRKRKEDKSDDTERNS